MPTPVGQCLDALVRELERGTPLAIAPGRVAFPSGTGDAKREKERKRLEEDLAKIEERLANADFQAKAPQQVIDNLQQRADAIREALDRLKDQGS